MISPAPHTSPPGMLHSPISEGGCSVRWGWKIPGLPPARKAMTSWRSPHSRMHLLTGHQWPHWGSRQSAAQPMQLIILHCLKVLLLWAQSTG